MPIIGGLEMLRHRDVTKQVRTPVIVNSADPLYERAALDAGAALFLAKPLGSAELLAAIEGLFVEPMSPPKRGASAPETSSIEYLRDGARRERILERLDPHAPELQRRIGALVTWLAGYYEMDAVWVDVLHRGSVLVEAAFSRPNQGRAYDLVSRVLISENIADARSPFLVGDLQSTPWFSTHPAARAGYRFFAGVPLRGPGQVGLGALCIAGLHARAFDAANLAVLQHCGMEFGHRIHTRRRRRDRLHSFSRARMSSAPKRWTCSLRRSYCARTVGALPSSSRSSAWSRAAPIASRAAGSRCGAPSKAADAPWRVIHRRRSRCSFVATTAGTRVLVWMRLFTPSVSNASRTSRLLASSRMPAEHQLHVSQ